MSQKKVTILGNEGANSVETTSYLLEDETGEQILIDSSIYTFNKLVESGEIDNITDVMVTHSHMDHIGGVPAIIQYKIDNNQPLNIIGGQDAKVVLNNMGMKDVLNDKNNIELTTYKQNSEKLEKKGILPFRVKHTSETIGEKTEFGTLESYGFALKNKNGQYSVITGDTSEIITPEFLNNQLSDKIGKELSYDDIQVIFQDVGETGNIMNGEPSPGFVHANAYFMDEATLSKYKGIHVPKSKLDALKVFREEEAKENGTVIENSLDRAEAGQVIDFDTLEITKNKTYELRADKIAYIEQRMEENLDIDGVIHNSIDGETLSNPTAEFITKLSNDFLMGDDIRFKEISVINITPETEDLAVIIENVLVQKRYYEGQRFNPNNEAINEKLAFIKKLNLTFNCSTPELEQKVLRIADKSIGLRVDNQIGKNFGTDFSVRNPTTQNQSQEEEIKKDKVSSNTMK